MFKKVLLKLVFLFCIELLRVLHSSHVLLETFHRLRLPLLQIIGRLVQARLECVMLLFLLLLLLLPLLRHFHILYFNTLHVFSVEPSHHFLYV